MKKIASPQELQTELRSIMAFVQGHGPEGKPDRQIIASKLRTLADRLVTAGAMNRDDYWRWLQNIKVGDVVTFDWTAGSGGHYSGKVRVIKVNRKSVRGELLEEVESWGGGVGYPKGHQLVVPRDPIDRRFSEMFNAPTPVGVDIITRPKSALGPHVPTDSELEKWWEFQKDNEPGFQEMVAKKLRLRTTDNFRWTPDEFERVRDYYVRGGQPRAAAMRGTPLNQLTISDEIQVKLKFVRMERESGDDFGNAVFSASGVLEADILDKWLVFEVSIRKASGRIESVTVVNKNQLGVFGDYVEELLKDTQHQWSHSVGYTRRAASS